MKSVSELLKQVRNLQGEVAFHKIYAPDKLEDVAEALGKARAGLQRRLAISYLKQAGASAEVIAFAEDALAVSPENKNKGQ